MSVQEINPSGVANKLLYKEEGGNRYVKVYNGTGSAWTALTPGKLHYNGDGTDPEIIALSDTDTIDFLVVPESAIPDATWAWAVCEGPVSKMVTPSLSTTVGHAFCIDNGAIADKGADPAYTAASADLGVFTEAVTTATAVDVYIMGRGWVLSLTTS